MGKAREKHGDANLIEGYLKALAKGNEARKKTILAVLYKTTKPEDLKPLFEALHKKAQTNTPNGRKRRATVDLPNLRRAQSEITLYYYKKQTHKQQLIIGLLVATAITIIPLYFLWRLYKEQEYFKKMQIDDLKSEYAKISRKLADGSSHGRGVELEHHNNKLLFNNTGDLNPIVYNESGKIHGLVQRTLFQKSDSYSTKGFMIVSTEQAKQYQVIRDACKAQHNKKDSFQKLISLN